MIKLINYANDVYRPAQQLNSWTGKYIAHFDEVLSFGPKDIDPEFAEANKIILSYQRGNGLWLWKPYFIHRVMEQSNNGDYIFYLDAGAFFIQDIHQLIPYVSDENPLFVTDIPLMECNWTKPSCITYFNAEEFLMTNQVQATYIFLMVNDISRSFVKDYLELCQKPQLLLPEGLGKHDKIMADYSNRFVAHREDQSIFSIMCKMRGIKPHRDLSQRGFDPKSFYNPNYLYKEPEHPDDHYPTMVFLHKAPNPFHPIVWARYIKNRVMR